MTSSFWSRIGPVNSLLPEDAASCTAPVLLWRSMHLRDPNHFPLQTVVTFITLWDFLISSMSIMNGKVKDFLIKLVPAHSKLWLKRDLYGRILRLFQKLKNTNKSKGFFTASFPPIQGLQNIQSNRQPFMIKARILASIDAKPMEGSWNLPSIG